MVDDFYTSLFFLHTKVKNFLLYLCYIAGDIFQD